MKKSKLTLDIIREGMTPFQQDLLQEIWTHFYSKGEWKTLRELYSEHGKQKILKAFGAIGKGIGFEETSGSRWPRYHLRLLGILLTKDGKALQKLLERFFKYQRKLFKTVPLKDLSPAAEIKTDLGLTEEEVASLGHMLWIGGFGGGRGSKNDDWSVSAMTEAADLPGSGDMSVHVDKWVTRNFQAPGSIEPAQPQAKFPRGIFGGEPEAAVTSSPHPSEIALSLERLRKKYPDASKLGFLVMRYAEGKPFQQIVKSIKTTAEKHGLAIIRADENDFHAHLWENVRTLLHGCSFGIAVYERIEREEPNANVGLEVGYLMAMNKPVLLLKDKTVPELQSDLAGKLYKNFDPYDTENTIPEQLTRWLEDSGIIVPRR
jgi:hypothetical protein